jgi:hypothetical protein
MPILGPKDMPKVLKVASEDLKAYVLAQLGSPNVLVEQNDAAFEIVLRTTGDFAAGYFPLEQKFAYFRTQPLQTTYDLPEDAWWIQDVAWDPSTTRIDNIFGAESFLFNIGNISGIQNLLTDYSLLQQYRKFSQRILSNEGNWEVLGDNKIRLYPTPKGAFGVVVLYIPVVYRWRSPQAREITMRFMLAESKKMIGEARRKISAIPGPDGGQINLNGDALVKEGNDEKEKALHDAILLGEPLPLMMYNLLPFLLPLTVAAHQIVEKLCV